VPAEDNAEVVFIITGQKLPAGFIAAGAFMNVNAIL
jgi:hypothetical protein